MKSIKYKLLAFVAAIGFCSMVVLPGATHVAVAAEGTCDSASSCAKSGADEVGSTGSSSTSVGGIIKTVVSIMLFLLGAICVIMIIIGGIRYATSQGDKANLTGAKNTILYAVVGLVVAIAAYAIVDFVLGQFIEA